MLKGSTVLHKHMRKSISSAVQSADVILYVLDNDFTKGDIQKIANYNNDKNRNLIIAVNKTDRTTINDLYPKLATLAPLTFVRAIIPVSAKTGFNIDILESEIKKIAGSFTSLSASHNPSEHKTTNDESFDDDTFTDQSTKFMSAEIIRGAVIKNTRDEIPHGVAVIITKFTDTNPIEIYADILCEKPTHKPIIIGKNGENLKKIGIMARTEIEKLTDTPVRLYTHVLVRRDWKNTLDFSQNS